MASKRILPLFDRILVQKHQAKNALSAGGIALPESVQKSTVNTAKVLRVGPGMRDKDGFKPMSVKEGDEVILSPYGGSEIEIDGEEFHIYNEHDILAILSEN